jgi:hypothetical protein
VSSPRWFNAKFVVGIVIVVAPMFIGARVLASADRYADVYIARLPLVPGQRVSAADLTVGRIRFVGEGSHYVAAGRPPIGYLVTRYVAPGELLPLGALTAAGPAAFARRLVTLPVGMGHVPVVLSRGDLVDVYVSQKANAGRPAAPPKLVVAAVPVESVAGSGALASSGTVSVVLAVPEELVVATVKAIESGTIDVVRVPDAAIGAATVPSPPATASP